jgi:MinD superfamily P-loop ATPase
MKEVTIISGKGGTGKTSLVSTFASLASSQVLCDADVDAADLHLIMNPNILERYDFTGGGEAIIDHDRCTECGLCRQYCRWEAIDETFTVDSILCEGCGVCVYFCPEKAIDFPVKTCGEYYISETRFGPMVHARLGIAEENSGKLVTQVRKTAQELAEKKGLELIITDGPPGIGCPVIASIGGSSAVLVVAEPTVSGVHDMDRVIGLAKHFKIPAAICINKYDLNIGISEKVQEYAEKIGVGFLGMIPFDPAFTHAMVQAKTLFEYDDGSHAAKSVLHVWENFSRFVGI